MDVTELHDEENLLVQMQDRWERSALPLRYAKNLLLRQTLGMGCKQRSVKSLALQMGTTQKAVQKKLVMIIEKLRHHDDSIEFWKYLNRLTPNHPIDYVERRKPVERCSPITIGEDCWLGGGVTVCPGVTVGDRCIIGAGSVVVKDIPSDSLAVGNPCRVIRKINQKQ